MNGGLGIGDGANIGDMNVGARIEIPMNQAPQDPAPHAPASPVEELLSDAKSSAILDDSVLHIHVVQPCGCGGGRGRGRGHGGGHAHGGGCGGRASGGGGSGPQPVADAATAADSQRVPLGSFLNADF